MDIEPKIFIIMPFSETTLEHTDDYWTNHYEHLLKPILRDITEIPVERSKAIRTDILRDIIKNLVLSQIVLADITDLNANVMWELGVRQSFKDGTIIIAEDGTDIPFDISIKGIISYPKLTSDSNYHCDMSKFKEDLATAINDCIENPNTNDSHVLETLSGRGTIYQIIFHDETIRKLDALIHELETNILLCSSCINALKFNKKIKMGDAGYKWVTHRFRGHSAELLLTTRYLAEKPQFYSDFEDYFARIRALNTQIDLWPFERAPAESYLDKFCKSTSTMVKKQLKKIKSLKEKLENQIP